MTLTPYPQPADVLKHWVEAVRTSGRNLTKWEADFIDSVEEQVWDREWVSEKQQNTLEEIYANKT